MSDVLHDAKKYITFLIIFIIPLQLLTLSTVAACLDQKSFSIGEPKFTEEGFTKAELNYNKEKVKQFFNFALDNYLTKGYPYDEIRPISCVPKKRNFDNLNDLVTNDVLGNFTITLLDSLTTVAILGDRKQMKELIDIVLNTYDDFAIDSTVQVFETSIRIIGSLMSTHLYVTDPRKKVYLGEDYDGESLIRLAEDIAERLLPAYMTKTGLPVSRINLLTKFKELTVDFLNENNAAGMASPMFEFTMLSYLTKDKKYEKITRYAFDKIWSMRSPLDLVPMSFNPQDRSLYSTMTGIGASIDSFYEYALKGAVLFDDEELYKVWNTAYDALKVNAQGDWFYYNVETQAGQLTTPWIDALGGFFPGLQTLDGDVQDAIPKHLMYMNLWDTFGGIPERWSFESNKLTKGILPSNHLSDGFVIDSAEEESEESIQRRNIPLEWYPLRPEFIESTYFLYRATKDPFYLNIGVRILRDLEERFMGPCGFAGIQNLYTGEVQDRMESFVLSETLKYLYLLFDEDNEIHRNRDNIIFSTEGHPLWLTPSMKRDYKENGVFNDTIWINHLEMCEYEEMKYLERMNKEGTEAEKGFFQFAKKLLSKTASDPIKSEPSSIREEKNSQNFMEDECNFKETEERYNEAPAQCIKPSISHYSSKRMDHDKSVKWLQYSDILSHYDRLFEVPRRFEDTLTQPKLLSEAGYEPMTLETSFYSRYANPKYSQCRIKSTSMVMDLIFMSVNGTYHRPTVSSKNSTIHCETFQGKRRLRLEKISPDLIDTYGHLVSPQLFQEVQRRDIYNDNCDSLAELYTPSALYRVIKVDGIDVPEGHTVELPHDELFTNETLKEASSLGLNSLHQLMIDCTPVINIQIK
ncbi:alpha mannosidase-like protein [Maudiozyma exigua]|uniref:alpha-1,2-Mannosidase n=1 Tax=Maudiozyma exigua TaxID=34358 RepID=A0A9P6WA84_MAUEX|nr:alpha mannosidase-like protein [Kazachstania exigua]